jgi:hypothetical protein
MTSELLQACEALKRDTGGRKVLICSAEGDVLVHLGEAGTLDEEATDVVAEALADAIVKGGESRATSHELNVPLPSGLAVYATSLGPRAALGVLYDAATNTERIERQIRHARALLLKCLPSESGPSESGPSAS